MKVTVAPDLLKWARERSSLEQSELGRRVGVVTSTVAQWEMDGEVSLPQLRNIARVTHTPFGSLFLSRPPVEQLPITDLRTLNSEAPTKPSPELLDTIHQCQRRQEWYRRHLQEENVGQLDFVASVSESADAEEVAERIRTKLDIQDGFRDLASSSDEAISVLSLRAEEAGILVMRNGVVGNNTSRILSVDEFRGFCLSDSFAPLVFVNAADAKSAQLFTLAHELAHVWVGATGVTGLGLGNVRAVERLCNSVAANILMPLKAFKENWHGSSEPLSEARRLARIFRVSSLAMIIRAREAGVVSDDQFREMYESEAKRISSVDSAGGGNFYSNQNVRLGKPFARAVIASTIDGGTTFTEAFSLLDVTNTKTFEKLAEHMDVAA